MGGAVRTRCIDHVFVGPQLLPCVRALPTQPILGAGMVPHARSARTSPRAARATCPCAPRHCHPCHCGMRRRASYSNQPPLGRCVRRSGTRLSNHPPRLDRPPFLRDSKREAAGKLRLVGADRARDRWSPLARAARKSAQRRRRHPQGTDLRSSDLPPPSPSLILRAPPTPAGRSLGIQTKADGLSYRIPHTGVAQI